MYPDRMPASMQPVESGASFERELSSFRDLIGELRDVPDLVRSEQMAVAFLVEDMKRESPEDWNFPNLDELWSELPSRKGSHSD